MIVSYLKFKLFNLEYHWVAFDNYAKFGPDGCTHLKGGWFWRT